ncbi:unnamed protein product [Symbiodinium microadriaticum]|nr:unnamed protein product [Symbiodinium microadriaticum]
MADAGVYFTSWVSGTEAPVVISFSPTRGKQDYLRDTAIVLRILLREIPRVAVPLKTSRTGFAGVEMEDNETVSAESMSQAVCGSLFLEMWTNDAAGFPLPRGCYYGPLYTDAPQFGGQTEASYREYFIEFDPKHALKEECVGTNRQSSCVYQLVLNMRIQHDEFITRRELISLYTYCAGRAGYATICGPRYSVIEYGQVIPKNGVWLPEINTTKLGRVELLDLQEASRLTARGLRPDMQYDIWENALQMQASDAIMDELSGLEISTLSLGLRAWPMEPEFPLQSSARFRLMFQPLTLWRLAEFPSDCNATCVAAPGLSCLDQRGLPVAPCEVKALVDTNAVSDVPMQLNVMEFSFPNAFDEIPEDRSDEAHLLAFRGLRLPNEGFFTICMLVQYYELPDVPPSMVEAMPCAKKVPTSTATSGRILVEGQAGNGPKPFAFDRDNELVLRLILGASLRNLPSGNVILGENETEVLMPAEIRVQLPPDYMCSVVGDGTADPDGSKGFFTQDLNNDGYADSPMATVRSGTWSSRESVCTFTLGSTAALFANQFVDVRVSVVNPRLPLRKDDPLNVWSILLISPYGDTLGGPAPFISLEDEKSLPGWAGNLAVLGRLEGESIQPTILAEGANNTLNVFLQMTQAMPMYSYLVIDAPPGYDFTTACAAVDMDPAYYQDWEALPWGTEIIGPRATTSSIGQDVNCTTDDWQRPAGTPPATAPFTRAYLRIGRTLLLGKYYAFQINITNAMEWNISQHSQWRLWLQSPAGYMVDGSTYPVQFNAARIDTIPVLPHDLGWAVYDSDMKLPLTLNFGAARLLPTVAFEMSAFLTVYPLTPSSDGQPLHVRVLAPVGYVWIPHAEQGWLGYVPNVTCRFCELFVTPEVRHENELLLPEVIMRLNQNFGFVVRLRVPTRPPTRSTNAFFLELGYNPAEFNLDRMQAASFPAPPLRVVNDVSVASLCNMAGFADNVLDFSLRIASPLAESDGILLAGDELTRGTLLRCWPEVLPGMLGITPENGHCLVFEHETSLLPMIKLWLKEGQLPAGFYGFRFRRSRNPTHPAANMAHWNLATFSALDMYPTHRILDFGIDTPSPRVLGFLGEAGLLEPPDYEAPSFGRNDQPLSVNTLTFYFCIDKAPVYPRSVEHFPLALRGPAGFEFLEDCSGGLRSLSETDQTRFPCRSSFASQPWCPRRLASWPSQLEPMACLGLHHTARISVPNGLYLATLMPEDSTISSFTDGACYGFEIQVRNPELPPSPAADNVWALDFGVEASRPFESIQIRTLQPTESRLELATGVASHTWWAVPDQYLPFRIDFMPSSTVPAPRMRQRRLQLGGGDPLLPDAEDGGVMIFASAGYEFAKLDFDVCALRLFHAVGQANPTLERRGREPWDLDALYSAVDAICRVGDEAGVPSTEGGGDAPVSMIFLLTDRKAIVQGVAYTLEGRVRNPSVPTWPSSAQWRLETYKRFIATGQRIALDRIYLQSIPILKPALAFQVNNSALEYGASAKVFGVEVTITLSDSLQLGDSIEISAPPGLELRESLGNASHPNASQGRCLDFGWPTTFRPLREDVEPNCRCWVGEELQCWLIVNISHVGADPVLEQETEIRFTMSVINSAVPKDSIRSWWNMVHWAAQDRRLLSAGSVPGWPVYGLLNNVTAIIGGWRQRAGSISDISITFIPTVWGSTMEINFYTPQGFNFENVRPGAPLLRDERTQGSRVVVTNGDFRPFEKHEIFLGEAQLGLGGGPTRISLDMYTDAMMTTEVARRINFFQGFVQPASVSLHTQLLQSETVVRHYQGELYDSVAPLLPPFALQLSRMEFFVVLSHYVMAGDVLLIQSLTSAGGVAHEPINEEGYEPRIDLCNGPDAGADDKGTWSCGDIVGVNFTQMSLIRDTFDVPVGLRMVLLPMDPRYVVERSALDEIASLTDGQRSMALEANRNYRVQIWLLPSMAETWWSISTEDITGFPTSSNDGETSSIAAVPEMAVTVAPQVGRSPPLSAVYITITIKAGAGQTAYSRLLVILPYGFVPVGALAPDNARAMVELDLRQIVNPLVDEMSYQFRVLTPRRTNLDPRWFVLARSVTVDEITGVQSDRIVGWGSAPGFGVEPCFVEARYGALPRYTGWMSLTWKAPQIAGARYALFTAPNEFRVSCPPPSQAAQPCEPFQLSEGMPNTITELPITRTLNVTMAKGWPEGQDFVFFMMLLIETPAVLTSLQPWELRLLDQVFTVIDAALEIPSLMFAPDLQAENPTLSWLTPPQFGEAATAAIQTCDSFCASESERAEAAEMARQKKEDAAMPSGGHVAPLESRTSRAGTCVGNDVS